MLMIPLSILLGTQWHQMSLTKEAVKIFDVHFPYNKKLEHGMNFQSHIVKIESVQRLWCVGNLTVEGKVLVF